MDQDEISTLIDNLRHATSTLERFKAINADAASELQNERQIRLRLEKENAAIRAQRDRVLATNSRLRQKVRELKLSIQKRLELIGSDTESEDIQIVEEPSLPNISLREDSNLSEISSNSKVATTAAKAEDLTDKQKKGASVWDSTAAANGQDTAIGGNAGDINELQPELFTLVLHEGARSAEDKQQKVDEQKSTRDDNDRQLKRPPTREDTSLEDCAKRAKTETTDCGPADGEASSSDPATQLRINESQIRRAGYAILNQHPDWPISAIVEALRDKVYHSSKLDVATFERLETEGKLQDALKKAAYRSRRKLVKAIENTIHANAIEIPDDLDTSTAGTC